MKREFQPPRLLVSARSLTGVSHAPRERLLELSARYQEPRSLAVALSKALEAGAEGVLAMPSVVRPALAELDREVPLFAVLPEQFEIAIEPGLDGWSPAVQRSIGPITQLRLAWTELAHSAAPADLTARVARTLEIEAALLPRHGLRAVVLAAEVTDFALAAGHRAFFARTLRFVRSRFGVAAGLETGNLALLLARLAEWSVAPDFVVAPLNPSGLRMKPSTAEVLAALASSKIPVVATELRAGGGCALGEGVRYARAHHAHGVAPDLSEFDDAGLELRVLAPVE